MQRRERTFEIQCRTSKGNVERTESTVSYEEEFPPQISQQERSYVNRDYHNLCQGLAAVTLNFEIRLYVP